MNVRQIIILVHGIDHLYILEFKASQCMYNTDYWSVKAPSQAITFSLC